MSESNTTKQNIAELTVQVSYIEKDIADIKDIQSKVPGMLDNLRNEIKADMKSSKEEWVNEIKKYVTNERFTPVQLIVFGMVGAILLSVLATLLSLVIMK